MAQLRSHRINLFPLQSSTNRLIKRREVCGRGWNGDWQKCFTKLVKKSKELVKIFLGLSDHKADRREVTVRIKNKQKGELEDREAEREIVDQEKGRS